MEKDDKQYGNQDNGVYSIRLRAGRRRTYFFDVRTTRSNDYYLTITESKKRADESGYDRHKVFLYKEDFNKFLESLNKTMDHIKTELLPDYDFDQFHREREERSTDWDNNHQPTTPVSEQPQTEPADIKGEVEEAEEVSAETTNPSPEVNEDDLKWD